MNITLKIKELIDGSIEIPDEILLSVFELSGAPLMELFSLSLELK